MDSLSKKGHVTLLLRRRNLLSVPSSTTSLHSVMLPHSLSSHHAPLVHRPPPRSIPKCCWTKSLVPSIPPPKSSSFTASTMLSFRPHQITTTTTDNSASFYSSRRTRRVICMASPRRVKMVAKQIHREISDMLLTDEVLKFATLPEVGLGADRYLSSITTISDVEISSDLQVVKVYVSVFGDERGKEVAISGLKAKAKYVRAQLGRRMSLRLTPEVRFIQDDSIERGNRVISILDEIKNEGKASKPKVEKQAQVENRESPDVDEDEEDWEDADTDEEDIIYVE